MLQNPILLISRCCKQSRDDPIEQIFLRYFSPVYVTEPRAKPAANAAQGLGGHALQLRFGHLQHIEQFLRRVGVGPKANRMHRDLADNLGAVAKGRPQ